MEQTYRKITATSLPQLKPGTKVLFANVPADGHFNPLTSLAVHLQEMGCDVRWYSSAWYAEKIKKLQVQWYPFKKALDAPGDKIDEIFPKRLEYKNQIKRLNYDMINYFILRSTEYFEDMCEIHRHFPFEVVIADVCFSAIPLVKERLQVPVIAIGIVPLGETSKELPPPGLGMTPSKTFWGRRKQDLLRFLTDRVLFSKPNKLMRQILETHGVAAGNSNVFDIIIKKATLVLQSGTPGFEYARKDMNSNIRFIGPLLPYKHKRKQQPWTHEKLTQYNKIILVTQGTVEKNTEKIIVPTLEAFKGSDYLVIATTGGSHTAALQLRYQQYQNIIIEDFIPFTDVMPYADVYVTNGGYGGILLGIEHKLPLVVAGVHEGKNEINARVGYFELGINLHTEKPSAAQIRKSVEQVIAHDKYRNNVEKLGNEFNRYNPQALCASYVASLLQPATPGRVLLSKNNIPAFAEN
jgi:MGT family glycosyltransferase